MSRNDCGALCYAGRADAAARRTQAEEACLYTRSFIAPPKTNIQVRVREHYAGPNTGRVIDKHDGD